MRRYRSDAPDAGLERDLGELAPLDHAGEADDDRQVDAFGADRPHPVDQRAGVEAELRDDLVGVRLLAAQRLEQLVVGDQRVALRVAADTDARERMREAGELVEQVAGVLVRAGGRRRVAADDERLVHACGREAFGPAGELAPPAHHARREMRDHFVAARGEALRDLDRARLAVPGRGGHRDPRARGSAATLSSMPRTGITS